MELLLLSNSTNHGGTMFSHAAETFADVSAGDTVTFVPYALADWDDYADRAAAALGRVRRRGRLRPPLQRSGPRDPRGRRGDDGRRQHVPAARLPVRPRRDRRAQPARARGRDPLRGRLRGHQRRLPHHPDHQRHADLPPAELRRARSRAVPDQPPLHRPGSRLDVHGRDARGAHHGVPRGERVPRSGAVRGLVAARQRGEGRGHRPRPSVPARRGPDVHGRPRRLGPAQHHARASTAADGHGREVRHDRQDCSGVLGGVLRHPGRQDRQRPRPLLGEVRDPRGDRQHQGRAGRRGVPRRAAERHPDLRRPRGGLSSSAAASRTSSSSAWRRSAACSPRPSALWCSTRWGAA